MTVEEEEAEEEEEEEKEARDLREQLRNVGQLKDVKEMVEEIDGKEEFVSSPRLERVNYCSPRECCNRPEF